MAMPRFSVIVPARSVQGFLRGCLSSVLDQPFGDLELIAVDDCSADEGGGIIDEYAGRDPRVVALHLARPGGAGPARNAGAARARGDYLLFLDGDDTLAPDALAAVDKRLRATGGPDVLLWDHARTDVWERVRPSGDGEFLARATAHTTPAPRAAVPSAAHAPGSAASRTDVFTAAERPAVLGVLPAAWNRAVRRDVWRAQALAFADGPYEDLPVAFGMLLDAERIAALDRVCVTWRRRRRGSASTTPGRHHLVAVDRYDDLLHRVARHPDAAVLAPALYDRAARHLLAILADGARVPPADRADFHRAAAGTLRRHRPSGVPLPAGLGSYGGYRSLRGADALRRGAAEQLRTRREAAARTASERYYRLQLRRPLDDNLVLYGAGGNRGVHGSPAAVYRKAREIAPHLHGVWAVNARDRGEVPAGVDHVVAGSRRYWEVLARAKYLVHDADFGRPFHKRPEQIFLQTHHGTPLKAMGMDLRRYPAAAAGVSFTRLLDHADQWDYSLSANPHSSEVRERACPSGYETLPTGHPRNDAYFTATADDIRALRARLGILPGTTAVLYAPTHRDYLRDGTPPLDPERLSRDLGAGYQLLVRTHPLYGPDAGPAALRDTGAILDVSRHPCVEELCLASDALLCDFSSLVFDYACLDRPIVVHSADWETFRRARGVYVDLLSGEPGDTPGPVADDENAVADTFRSGRWDGPHAARMRAAFRERFCPYDDGQAAERVVRRVLLGDDELLPLLPASERTMAPTPRVAEEGVRLLGAGV
ncbi:bifunctional glycosyltransferase family 2 protein/CDP-glycerol:glycerophosphate glycerophosphotransferase [Streptomyces sp. Pv4-95]|uniref:CDP-glycerol glycerophosphotransferase family protein n=1 Tax=Streptomyces sp. Pv4-95 TaxID=3049543 RepID=UPI0038919DC2